MANDVKTTLSADIEKLISNLKEVQGGYGKIDNSIKSADKSLEEMNSDLKRQNDIVKEIEKEEKRLAALQRKGTKDYSKQLKRVQGDLEVAKKEQKGLTEQVKKTTVAQKQSAKQADIGSKAFKKLGVAIAAAFTIHTLVQFGKEINRLAVQGEAFQNRAKVVFGESNKYIQEFAKKSSIALGLTRDEFLGAAAAIGDILVPLGLTRQEAAKMSAEAVKLGLRL